MSPMIEKEEKPESGKANKKGRVGVQSAKVYFLSALIVAVVSFLGSILAGSFSS
jgi:homoaconitase/3-isopropylmalate dehydratase large subunit